MTWFRTAAVATFVVLGACAGEPTSAVVAPDSIEVSADRRTVTVSASYPTGVGCAKDAGGLDVDVENGVATIRAVIENLDGADRCTLECASVVQSITLDQPLAESIRFEFDETVDSGCGGPSPLVSTTTTTTTTIPCRSTGARPFDIGEPVPGPPEADPAGDRDAAGAAAMDELSEVLLGVDADPAVLALIGAGWTVTVVVEPSATPTTMTPDLLWSRITVTTCDGRVDLLTFD